MKVNEKHARRKAFWLGEGTVFDLFAGVLRHEFLSLPVIEPLPADAELLGVTHSWERRAFGFMFCSMEWPEVPEGACAPDHCDPYARTTVRLIRANQDVDVPTYVKPEGT